MISARQEAEISAPLIYLFRDGFTKPRLAARHLLNRNFAPSVVIQGAVLLAILNALAFYFVFDILVSMSPEPIVVVTPPLMTTVLEHLIFVTIYSAVIAALSRAFGNAVTLLQSATIFVWFNILQLIAAVAGILTLVIAGPFGLIIVFLPLIWTIWAVGQYWGELVRIQNNFMGFLLAATGLMIALPILGLITTILNLPNIEILTDV